MVFSKRQRLSPPRDSFSSEVALKAHEDQFVVGNGSDASDGPPGSPISLGEASNAGSDDGWQLLGCARKAEHPLAGLSHATLAAMGREYAESWLALRDEGDIRNFVLGAVAAGMMDRGRSVGELRAMYDEVEGMTAEEKRVLVQETSHRWRQPWNLYFVVASTSGWSVEGRLGADGEQFALCVPPCRAWVGSGLATRWRRSADVDCRRRNCRQRCPVHLQDPIWHWQ
jgi:hypothetical protein